jgi:AcrR family transcriptional regulator
MAESEIAQKWIEAGYDLFASNGPNDFKVEKLAVQLGLNKSGFYHYFVDRETFFDELMKYHVQNGVKFAKEVSMLKDFMPGYFLTLIKYQTGLQVQIQLRKNINVPMFKEYYLQVKKRNNIYQLPLWAKYINVSDMQLASELFEIAMDLLAVRLESDKITFDFLEGIIGGIKKTVEKLTSKK